ncbi:ATP-binding protein [Runella sp.]|uniref:ATP-binding protein n=1 Tax=Runella sp. TaxID=1960881 RepID=UPI00301ABD7F
MKKNRHSLLEVRLIYVITTIFLVGLSIYLFFQIKNLIDISNWVNHTNQVNQSLQKLSSSLLEAESEHRGYLLSGEAVMLEKRDLALNSLKVEQHLLDSLLKDNPEQIQNLKKLNLAIVEGLVNIKNTSAGKVPEYDKVGSIEEAKKIAYVKHHIEVMRKAENQLLTLRTKDYTQLSFKTPFFLTVLSMCALMMLLVSYFRINTELHNTQNLLHELLFENVEKGKRAAELVIANIELIYENKEKEKRAAELVIANNELVFQNGEKEKRAAELIIANKELVFENEDKEKRAAELVIANVELLFQNGEKEKRAAELVIANKELFFQNGEKEKRAAELVIANKELFFQNGEKEKRAAELVIANKELFFQNGEKEKRASELIVANKELESLNYISSHDLQEPLRSIQMFASRIVGKDYENLTDNGKSYFKKMQNAAVRMQTLLDDLLNYSRTNNEVRKFKRTNLNTIVDEIIADLKETIDEKQATIETIDLPVVDIIPFQFRQLIHNLISNALKFSNSDTPPHIQIKSNVVQGDELESELPSDWPEKGLREAKYCHIVVSDNGIGFEPEYSEKIFEVFQRLHGREKYKGTGMGLAIVKKIVENHNGVITATSELNKGAKFDIYFPFN